MELEARIIAEYQMESDTLTLNPRALFSPFALSFTSCRERPVCGINRKSLDMHFKAFPLKLSGPGR